MFAAELLGFVAETFVDLKGDIKVGVRLVSNAELNWQTTAVVLSPSHVTAQLVEQVKESGVDPELLEADHGIERDQELLSVEWQHLLLARFLARWARRSRNQVQIRPPQDEWHVLETETFLAAELVYVQLGRRSNGFHAFDRLCDAHDRHVVHSLGEVLSQTFLIRTGCQVVFFPLFDLLHLAYFVRESGHS